jgi:hypothetical protein
MEPLVRLVLPTLTAHPLVPTPVIKMVLSLAQLVLQDNTGQLLEFV